MSVQQRTHDRTCEELVQRLNPMERGLLSVARCVGMSSTIGSGAAVFAHHVILASRRGLGDLETDGEARLIDRVLRSGVHESRSGRVIVDVGANIGEWTGVVLERAGDRDVVHCFEPTPSTFVALEARLAHDARVRLNNCALSDATGTARLHDYGEHSGLNSLVVGDFHDRDTELHTVPTVRGDSYCADAGIDRIDLLKIDVEGFEWEVLTGFSGMLGDRRIDVVQFEYGYINAVTRHLMRDFFELFEAFGYVVGPLRPRGPQFRAFHYSDDGFESGPNYVAALPAIAGSLA